MNVKSFEARLKKIHPLYSCRIRQPQYLYDGSVDVPVGVFKGFRYSNFRFNAGYLERGTKPFIYKTRYNPITKQTTRNLISRKRRGRDELIWLLTSSLFVKGRPAKQLLKL